MNFTDAIITCFRKYLGFSGRASRSEYWWFVLFLLVLGFSAHMIDGALYGDRLISRVDIDELTYGMIRETGPVATAFWLLTSLPLVAAGSRRMHDTGRSALFLFAPFLVVVGLVTLGVVLGVVTSTTGGQQLGSIAAPVLLVALVAAILSSFLLVWWLSRPSQRGPNAFGPEPSVR